MSMVEQQFIFLQHLARLIDKADELGLVLSGGELYRTVEQQKLHIEAGRSKTMSSQHLKRLAIDMNFFLRQGDGKLKLVYEHPLVTQLGAFWEQLDPANQWGGRWKTLKDTPHFERNLNKVQATEPVAAPALSRGIELLSDSVGFRCANQADDVELIQRLLNLHRDELALEEPLQCDGKFGPKTQQAITRFETKVFGETAADNRIRPRDNTLAALLKKLPQTLDSTLLQMLFLRPTSTRVEQFAEPIQTCLKKYDISTPLRQAHFLAQIGHESAELCFTEELASGRAYEGRSDLGNTQPGDGARFKGRGLIQLTGRANYKAYRDSSGFDVDFLEQPELIAEDLTYSVDVAGWYWQRHDLNALADADDLMAITKRINGGTNGLEDRRRLFRRAHTLLTE